MKRVRKQPTRLSEEEAAQSKKPKIDVQVLDETKSLPKRLVDTLVFDDYPLFRPNRTPKQVLQAGSFGGTYYRKIKSGVTGKEYTDAWKEFPSDWFENLNVPRQVVSPTYFKEVNKYGVKCGGDLDMWESSGWITEIDPYGWFQWYCRFYLGRRSTDDERQISRWSGVCGAKGRFKKQLMNRIHSNGTTFDDDNISPVIRQTLLHWGYELTEKDFKDHVKSLK